MLCNYWFKGHGLASDDTKATATNMGLWQVGRTEVIEHQLFIVLLFRLTETD